ncbi:MAG: hypothetical protein HN405_05000 [Planctomycetes bacterium]|jgi:hypothetical protein|nr:hypothetical protein [Planctomycetota bacterium]MBT4028986.1 hypothetical protein [Planctomycetota bacterium]MBT4560254.1 hypothetical protein [Planctomycetota bacterium]
MTSISEITSHLSGLNANISVQDGGIGVSLSGDVYYPIPMMGDRHDVSSFEAAARLEEDAIVVTQFELELSSTLKALAYVAYGGDTALLESLAEMYELKIEWADDERGELPARLS